MSGVILQVHDLTKRFGGIVANRRISFRVEEGELAALIGPNGAGKSTLFKMICGVPPEGSSRRPEEGRIVFRGRDITRLKAHAICRLGLALVFQETEILRHMTVLDNVTIGAMSRTASWYRAREEAESTLEQVGLAGRAAAPAADLTIADKKRLELARALATRPRLLMLDEAMAGLTPREVQEAVALVRRINGSGVTVILIEHVLEAVMAAARRIIVMDQGRVPAHEIVLHVDHDEGRAGQVDLKGRRFFHISTSEPGTDFRRLNSIYPSPSGAARPRRPARAFLRSSGHTKRLPGSLKGSLACRVAIFQADGCGSAPAVVLPVVFAVVAAVIAAVVVFVVTAVVGRLIVIRVIAGIIVRYVIVVAVVVAVVVKPVGDPVPLQGTRFKLDNPVLVLFDDEALQGNRLAFRDAERDDLVGGELHVVHPVRGGHPDDQIALPGGDREHGPRDGLLLFRPVGKRGGAGRQDHDGHQQHFFHHSFLHPPVTWFLFAVMLTI
jgi:branched-chain amino acid transport system ATP-binding protein